LLECYQLSDKMGAIQSQLKSRKARRQVRKQAKQQQQASNSGSVGDKESADANEALSPSSKRKIGTFLKNLSPRPRTKNDNSREAVSVPNEKETPTIDNERTEQNNNHLSEKNYLQSDSQADSAINLDNQSDSAIQIIDRDNSENFKELNSEPVVDSSEVANCTSVNPEITTNSIVVENEAEECAADNQDAVPVIVNENADPDENEDHGSTKYLAVEGQSDTGISDISGTGHSPVSESNDIHNLLLLPPNNQKTRRGSASSTTSTSSDEELPMRSLVAAMRGSKSRSWGLIKQVVHWSPFVQVYKKKYPWVQLAGHNGAFKPCDNGTILKKLTEKEYVCLNKILDDTFMLQITPKFYGKVEKEGVDYVKLQDLLAEFDNPSVCDIKMGTRTYLEEELIKAREKLTMRKDMYEKMVKVDKNEPTEEEHTFKAVTKPRYMQWRERLSSTATLGFRIDGIKQADRDPDKNFKTVRTNQEVAYVLRKHIDYRDETRLKLLERLKEIRSTLEKSKFFASHEVIGSSVLLVHDQPSEGVAKANVWMIDFGKTTPLNGDKALDHRTPWVEGNQEDGYLFGLDNLVNLFENLSNIPAPEGLEDDQPAVG